MHEKTRYHRTTVNAHHHIGVTTTSPPPTTAYFTVFKSPLPLEIYPLSHLYLLCVLPILAAD